MVVTVLQARRPAARMHVFYLHGFMSSPASSKAAFLADRLDRHRLTLHCPDLNEPDFSTVTTTRMVAQVETAVAALAPGAVTLIGSSLGAFVALHMAECAAAGGAQSERPIERLVLLAPALDFGRRRLGDIDDAGMARWRDSGWLELTHHAYGEVRRVHYALFTDAHRYDSFAARCAVPMLVLQGDRDSVVDPETVARFAAPRPHVRLVRLDDDHQLAGSLERVWSETAAFLELADERDVD